MLLRLSSAKASAATVVSGNYYPTNYTELGTNWYGAIWTTTTVNVTGVFSVVGGKLTNFQVVVIAGGGQGGMNGGMGGGGAGGAWVTNINVLSGLVYFVEVGLGGCNTGVPGAPSVNGTNSSFGTNTYLGSAMLCWGGGGVSNGSAGVGRSGGSGGGGGYSSQTGGVQRVVGYGNKGGNAAGNPYPGGGGGGASGAGANGSGTASGRGGNGLTNTICGPQWATNIFAGGGGAAGTTQGAVFGVGGLGGGGQGGVSNSSGTNGVAHTGGGGGAAGNAGGAPVGGNGGSGLVAARWTGTIDDPVVARRPTSMGSIQMRPL